LSIWLLIGIPAALVGSYVDSTLSDAGEIIGGGKVVVLEPKKWIGKRFPLLDYIDIGQELAKGRWLVLLYHHDCPKCQNIIRDLSQVSLETCDQRVALIAVPPYSETLPAYGERALIHGRLTSLRDWFAETPVVLALSDGEVELRSTVHTHLP
jgi:hypothetical protein